MLSYNTFSENRQKELSTLIYKSNLRLIIGAKTREVKKLMQKISQEGDIDLIIKMIELSLLRRKLKFKKHFEQMMNQINEIGIYR